jgi:hypothetical protein
MPLVREQAALREYIAGGYALPGKRSNLTADLQVLRDYLCDESIELEQKKILLAEAIFLGLRIKKAIEESNADMLAKLDSQNTQTLNRALSVAIKTLYEVDDSANIFTQITYSNITDGTVVPKDMDDNQATYDAIDTAIGGILTAQNNMLKTAHVDPIHGVPINGLGVRIDFGKQNGGGGADPVAFFNYTRPIKIGNKYRTIERILTIPQGTADVDNATVMQAINKEMREITDVTKDNRYTGNALAQNKFEKETLFMDQNKVQTALDGDKYRCLYRDDNTREVKESWVASTTNMSLSYHVQNTDGFDFFKPLPPEKAFSNKVRAANTLWDAIDAGTKGLANTSIDYRFPTIHLTERVAGNRSLQASKVDSEDMIRLASIALGVLISGYIPEFKDFTKAAVDNFIADPDVNDPEQVNAAHALDTINKCRQLAGDGNDSAKMDQVFDQVTDYINQCSSWSNADMAQLVAKRQEGGALIKARRVGRPV